MTVKCPYCPKVCAGPRWLTQHINGSPACEEKHLSGLNRGDSVYKPASAYLPVNHVSFQQKKPKLVDNNVLFSRHPRLNCERNDLNNEYDSDDNQGHYFDYQGSDDGSSTHDTGQPSSTIIDDFRKYVAYSEYNNVGLSPAHVEC